MLLEFQNCTHPLEYTKVAIVHVISGSISLLVCCAVIALIVFFKKWKFFGQRLILYLAVTALFFLGG